MRDRLESLRVQLGMPKDPQLAELIGISVRSLYNAMKGDASRRTATLIELAEQGASERAKVLLKNDAQRNFEANILLGEQPSAAPVPLAGKQRGFGFQQLEVRAPREAWNAEDGGPLADQLLRVLEDLDALKRRVEQIAAVAIRQQMQEAEKGKKP